MYTLLKVEEEVKEHLAEILETQHDSIHEHLAKSKGSIRTTKNPLPQEHNQLISWTGSPALSSRERVSVSTIRERGAGDVERVPLVEVVVDPERGVHADDGRGDDEGDEEVEPRVGERDGEHGGGREHCQHDAVVDLAAEADERLPLAAAEVEAEPGDEECQEDEHGHGAVDEAEEDEHQRGQRVVGAEARFRRARARASPQLSGRENAVGSSTSRHARGRPAAVPANARAREKKATPASAAVAVAAADDDEGASPSASATSPGLSGGGGAAGGEVGTAP
ncbi:LOW QUALITY PROTEIN: hypothetical protein U9M48_010837 [Paspalum notatum var. saurae]|uniref:Uncharacterized protein n=1 Tax=Paspalum notatum var. saurae TaxID=547442 RepID=A0AAQ3WGG6_PASNO